VLVAVNGGAAHTSGRREHGLAPRGHTPGRSDQ
jgi:hypothetical protein